MMRKPHRWTRSRSPDLNEAVGRLLRLWRWQAAMTQRQVAQVTGMQRPVVARLEAGRRAHTTASLIRYARATGADVRQVITLVDLWASGRPT